MYFMDDPNIFEFRCVMIQIRRADKLCRKCRNAAYGVFFTNKINKCCKCLYVLQKQLSVNHKKVSGHYLNAIK